MVCYILRNIFIKIDQIKKYLKIYTDIIITFLNIQLDPPSSKSFPFLNQRVPTENKPKSTQSSDQKTLIILHAFIYVSLLRIAD